MGRWTAGDPASIQDGLDLYEYVGSKPSSLIDVRGEEKGAPPLNAPEDVAQFEARQAAFEAGKKLESGDVKATRAGKDLPPPKGEELTKLAGTSKEAKELRLKYATKQGIEAGQILKENVTKRSAAAAAGSKDVPHFGGGSQKLVPEVGFHEGKTKSVGKNPGGEPKGARTVDLAIAKEPTSPAQWDALKGQGGSAVFESGKDLKLGAGRVPDKAGFKQVSGGLEATTNAGHQGPPHRREEGRWWQGRESRRCRCRSICPFDTGDARAAAQTANPAANTTETLLSDKASLWSTAKSAARDVYELTPLAPVDWMLYDVMGPRGNFRYDPNLAQKALQEGRNPFCAQCHGPGGALDPNSEWNLRARYESIPRLNQLSK